MIPDVDIWYPSVPRSSPKTSPAALLLTGSAAMALCALAPTLSTARASSLLLWGMNLLLLGIGVYQMLLRRHPLFSLRNLFLFGFIVFQTQSAADSLAAGSFGGVYISNTALASQRFIMAASLFLVVFLACYHAAVGQAARVHTDRIVRITGPQVWKYLAQASSMAFMSLFLIYGIPSELPDSVHNASAIAAVAVAAGACGLLGWVWVHYPTRPRVVLAACITLLAAAPAALADQFGRRPLLTLFGSLLWGMYFSRWHTLRPGKALTWMAIGAVVSVVPLALFTSARDPGEHSRSVFDQVTAIREDGSVSVGLNSLRHDEITGAMTLWAMENLGDADRAPLQSLQYLIELPIPRQLWPTKSVPLSTEFARLANVPGVNFERITIPAGILGSSWADGSWFAVALYAGLLGLLLGRLDRILFRRRHNPAVVVALGAGFGQVIAFARGETSVFIALFVFSVIAVAVILHLLSVGRVSVEESV